MRYLRLILFTVVFFLSLTAAAFAQDAPPPIDLGAVGLIALAMALNTGGVFFLVNAVNKWKPKLRERAPQWIPMIAMLSGPLLNGAGALLGDVFNYPFDFSPLIGAFGGTAAVAFDQVRKQRRRARIFTPRSRR